MPNTRGQPPAAAYNDLLFPFYIVFALFALIPAPNCSFKVHSLHVVNYAYYRESNAGLHSIVLLWKEHLKISEKLAAFPKKTHRKNYTLNP